MAEQTDWTNPNLEELSGGTLSSQDTICNQDNTNFNEPDENENKEAFGQSENSTVPQSFSQAFNLLTGNSHQNIPFKQETSNSLFPEDPSVFINEDTQMCVTTSGIETNGQMESPYNVISPCEPGDISSPFDTMESDGHDYDDSSIFSVTSGTMRRPMWNNEHFNSTTTPRESSDEDPYASSGSKRKRRRMKKDMHPSDNFAQAHKISSPLSLSESLVNGTEQIDIHGYITGTKATGLNNHLVNNSDSNLFSTFSKNNRRNSNASESNQSSISYTRDNNFPVIENSMGASVSSFNVDNEGTNNTENQQAKGAISNDQRGKQPGKAASLQKQYPSSANGCSLEIIVQPENQHRARYLTEGSRGPVKDRSQQGFPQLQLKGYTGKTSLRVYVGSESEEKVRPHGFYQACKVTGRNTTSCEEIEIEGTKVIQIPFDAQEPISVDCVGILKLRNADVELRIGPNRAKKRSQTVRLVFRVLLEFPGTEQPSFTLQVVSDRINCTQPRGQPEITKKSLDRCPVDGCQDLFIIGKNFHRGTIVVFQDSEEPDGSHWRQTGQIEKDTFNQTHLVVRVPAYHDVNITKSVNVQLYIEHDGKRCDPHSFTYDPSPKLAVKETSIQEKEVKKEPEDTLKNIIASSKIDRKYLEALFARLLCSSDVDNGEAKPAVEQVSQETVLEPNQAIQQANANLPLAFSSGSKQLPATVQKPVPRAVPVVGQITSTGKVLIRPQTFGTNPSQAPFLAASAVSSGVIMTPQLVKSSDGTNANTNISIAPHPAVVSVPQQQGAFQASASSVFDAVSAAASVQKVQNVLVKAENKTQLWPSQQVSFQNPLQGVATFSLPRGSTGNLVFTLPNNVNLANSVTQPMMVIANSLIQQVSPTTSVVTQVVNNSNNCVLQQQQPQQLQQQQPQQLQQQQLHHPSQNPSIPAIIEGVFSEPTLEQAAPVQVVSNISAHTVPLQNSTPVQEIDHDTRSSFSATVVCEQPTQVTHLNQNPMFSTNNLAQTRPDENDLPASLVVKPTSFAIGQSLSSNSCIPSNSVIGSANFTTIESSMQQAYPDLTNNMPSVDTLASQNSNHAGDMQWEEAPQQNIKPCANISLSQSAPQEMIFQSNSSSNLATSQQQVFSIPNAIDILEQAKASVPVESTNNGTFPSSLNPDSSLPLSLDEIMMSGGKVMDNSVLQSIISDCVNANSEPVGQSNIFPPKSIPSEVLNSSEILVAPTVFSSETTNQSSNSQAEQVLLQHTAASSDIDMLPAHMKSNDSQQNSDFTDASIYLVNPDEVQGVNHQQHIVQNTSLANIEQSHIPNSFVITEQIHQNVSLNTANGSNNTETISSQAFQTIDSSAIDLNSGNPNQTFSGFDLPPSSHVGS